MDKTQRSEPCENDERSVGNQDSKLSDINQITSGLEGLNISKGSQCAITSLTDEIQQKLILHEKQPQKVEDIKEQNVKNKVANQKKPEDVTSVSQTDKSEDKGNVVRGDDKDDKHKKRGSGGKTEEDDKSSTENAEYNDDNKDFQEKGIVIRGDEKGCSLKHRGPGVPVEDINLKREIEFFVAQEEQKRQIGDKRHHDYASDPHRKGRKPNNEEFPFNDILEGLSEQPFDFNFPENLMLSTTQDDPLSTNQMMGEVHPASTFTTAICTAVGDSDIILNDVLDMQEEVNKIQNGVYPFQEATNDQQPMPFPSECTAKSQAKALSKPRNVQAKKNATVRELLSQRQNQRPSSLEASPESGYGSSSPPYSPTKSEDSFSQFDTNSNMPTPLPIYTMHNNTPSSLHDSHLQKTLDVNASLQQGMEFATKMRYPPSSQMNNGMLNTTCSTQIANNGQCQTNIKFSEECIQLQAQPTFYSQPNLSCQLQNTEKPYLQDIKQELLPGRDTNNVQFHAQSSIQPSIKQEPLPNRNTNNLQFHGQSGMQPSSNRIALSQNVPTIIPQSVASLQTNIPDSPILQQSNTVINSPAQAQFNTPLTVSHQGQLQNMSNNTINGQQIFIVNPQQPPITLSQHTINTPSVQQRPVNAQVLNINPVNSQSLNLATTQVQTLNTQQVINAQQTANTQQTINPQPGAFLQNGTNPPTIIFLQTDQMNPSSQILQTQPNNTFQPGINFQNLKVQFVPTISSPSVQKPKKKKVPTATLR